MPSHRIPLHYTTGYGGAELVFDYSHATQSACSWAACDNEYVTPEFITVTAGKGMTFRKRNGCEQ